MAIITISRGTMSGGESLAKCLSEKLSIPAVSQEILQEASDRFGISQSLLLQQLEKTKGLIRGPSSERGLYLTAINWLWPKGPERAFVYYGHAGHLLMKGVPHVLKVQVIAPLNRRAQKLARPKRYLWRRPKKHRKMDESRISGRGFYTTWIGGSLYMTWSLTWIL